MLTLAQWVALERRTGQIRKAKLQATILLCGAGGLLTGGVAWSLVRLAELAGMTRITPVFMLSTTLACLLAAWTYYFFAVWAKMPEADVVKRAMRRRQAG
jgi:hypothetical protein